MKKILGLVLTTLILNSTGAEAIYAPESIDPYECSRTLLNGKVCNRWYSLDLIEDTIPDRPGVELRPYRWYSNAAKKIKRIVLHGIRFDFDKSNIKAESLPILQANMSQLMDHRNTEIRIIGHTDDWGSDAYNQKLSMARSQSVMNYFVNQGLESSHVSNSGEGESQPVDTNATDSGRYNNRRIEIEIVHQ